MRRFAGPSASTFMVALFTTSSEISLSDVVANLGTSNTDPAFTCMLGGISFASRMTCGVVLNLAAIVSIFSRAAVTLCAVQLESALVHLLKFSLNFCALISGSKIFVVGLPGMIGRLN